MSSLRVAVLYFSQTGNTEKTARAIAQGLESSGAAVELLDILKTDLATLSSYDMLGIGTPVFYFREPVIVERFIKRIPPPGSPGQKPVFLFLTSGGHPGNTFFHMSRAVTRRGFLLVDAYGCHGYDTFPPFKGAGRFLGHPDAVELDQARVFGAQLLERTRAIQEGRREFIPVFKRLRDRFGRLSIVFRNRLLAWLILPRKILVAGKCTRCGLCVRHCPANVIAMQDYPVFKRGCIDCYMCERVCPEEAIQCDWTFITRALGAGEQERVESGK